MPGARFAVLDPSAGMAGDMLLGALIDAGAPLEWLQGVPERLGIPEVTVGAEAVDRNGIRCIKVTVTLPDGRSEGPAQPHGAHEADAPHGPGDHGHGHGHRSVRELVALVDAADLSPWVRDRARRAFELIGQAEGKVHGQPADEVLLHEVGALDALVDVVAGIEGFEQLGITDVYARPVALGNGWVRSAHGTIPVPAPATALLAEGLEIGTEGPVTGEATTPTGAALLRVLSRGPAPGHWRMTASGWGAGSRDPEGYANAVRLMLGERAPEATRVVTVATDVDDLSPEYVEPLREALFAAGALDVQVWTTAGKKGRPSFRIEALVVPEGTDAVADAFFRHSTTAGVRCWDAKRVTLPRRQVSVPTSAGTAQIKVVEAPDGPRAKPEYDDVTALARAEGRPAHRVADGLRRQVMNDGPGPEGSGQTP